MIRNLTDEEIAAIETAKKETGCKSASKAVMTATKSFKRLIKIVSNLQEENNRLRMENRKLKLCITCVTEAASSIGTILGTTSEQSNGQENITKKV